jgi:hypothetical protein
MEQLEKFAPPNVWAEAVKNEPCMFFLVFETVSSEFKSKTSDSI